jgi:hypothetical protein
MSKILKTRWIVASLVVVASVSVAYLVIIVPQNQETEAKPSLRMSNDVCEIGTTSIRKSWRVPFQIGNSGHKRLVINKVDAACCGDSSQETIVIPPGETAEVSVSLDTRIAFGAVENVVSFTTSDPDCPRLNLTVRAWVIGDEATSPAPADHRDTVSVLIRK